MNRFTIVIIVLLSLIFRGRSTGMDASSSSSSLSQKQQQNYTSPSTYINVHIPTNLHKVGGYPHIIAPFGSFYKERIHTKSQQQQQQQQHGNMFMNIYHIDNDLCTYPFDKSTIKQYYPKGRQLTSPYALMINRVADINNNNCSFVTQARNAQEILGSSILIIADDRCLCSDVNCQEKNKNTKNMPPCQHTLPKMYSPKSLVSSSSSSLVASSSSSASNNAVDDISIPVILLNKVDSDNVRIELLHNLPVLVDMRWHPPTPSKNNDDDTDNMIDPVDLSLWMNPLDNVTKVFLKDFTSIFIALGNSINFIPHYMIHDGTLTNCYSSSSLLSSLSEEEENFNYELLQGQEEEEQEQEEEDNVCYDVCTNNGRYCYPSHKILGRHVVNETLRRLCIWKHYGPQQQEDNNNDNTDKTGIVWFNYINYFDEHCSYSNETFGLEKEDEGFLFFMSSIMAVNNENREKCIMDAYNHAKINIDDINSCMKDSGDTNDDVPNTLLDNNLQIIKEYGIYISPTIQIGADGDFITQWPTSTIVTSSSSPSSLLSSPSSLLSSSSSSSSLVEPEASTAIKSILNEICNQFSLSSSSVDSRNIPEICTKCIPSSTTSTNTNSINDLIKCSKKVHPFDRRKASQNKKQRKHRGFWFFVLLIFISGTFGYLYHKKKQQQEQQNRGGGGGGGDSSVFTNPLQYALVSDQQEQQSPEVAG